jgi:hypothetical protein
LGIRHVIRSRNPAGETIPVLTKETTLSSWNIKRELPE